MRYYSTRETVKILENNLGIPINRSKLHFYDKINLIEVNRTTKGSVEHRVFHENDIPKLGRAIILSKLGFDLPTIDKALNKREFDSLEELRTGLLLRKVWIRSLEKSDW